MAWGRTSAKPSPEPMLEHCQLDPQEQTSAKKMNQNTQDFFQDYAFENIVCKMVAILFKPQFVNNDHATPATIITISPTHCMLMHTLPLRLSLD